ncbi:MAG: hypothetical protein IPH66_04185 [Crocinitomicaceae bacterium]|nr:hypothetical protein [Crocinitomicaceae bacterium]
MRDADDKKTKLWKNINLLSYIVIGLSAVLLLMKIYLDAKLLVSPLLPKYTVIFKNGNQINVFCFVLASLVPAIFLSIKKQYPASTICILLFFIVGLALSNTVSIYEYFYEFTMYL